MIERKIPQQFSRRYYIIFADSMKVNDSFCEQLIVQSFRGHNLDIILYHDRESSMHSHLELLARFVDESRIRTHNDDITADAR